MYDAEMPSRAPNGASREQSVETIQGEMAAFARRARGVAARMHPELSLVSFTILAHLDATKGCRATDLATEFTLDKSTVSRQITALERLGFVERRAEPTDQRVHLLRPTPAGTAVLAAATAARREAFRVRLLDWDEADLERFAAYLVRYNETSEHKETPAQAGSTGHAEQG
jgi:DNA-binding MarR family transcriptional regulator